MKKKNSFILQTFKQIDIGDVVYFTNKALTFSALIYSEINNFIKLRF